MTIVSNSAIEFDKIWDSKIDRVRKLLRRLPRDIGNYALLFFLNLFKIEESPSGEKWTPRNVGGSGYRSSRRGLLVKSGRLRKSIRLSRTTSPYNVFIGTRVPYAKYHNEGTARIPQRQFIGKSIALERRLQRMIKAKILWELRN